MDDDRLQFDSEYLLAKTRKKSAPEFVRLLRHHFGMDPVGFPEHIDEALTELLIAGGLLTQSLLAARVSP